jgi:hypothetical protein
MKSEISIARNYTNRLIELKRSATTNFLEAGGIFKEVRDSKLYKVEGHDTFESYVADVGYERSTAYKMILVYEKFGNVDSNPQIEEIGWTKLAKVAPRVTEENREKMLEIAQLSLSDINVEFRGECEHVWETVEVCKICGKRK